MPQSSLRSAAELAAPFALAWFTDERGRTLCSFGGDLAARAVAGAAPQAAVLASTIAAEGLLPPQGCTVRAVIEGHLLSVAGDRVVFHALFAAPPARGAAPQALNAVRDFESAYRAHLGSRPADPATFAAAPARVARVFASPLAPTAEWPASPRLFVHASVEPRGPGVLVLLRLRNFTREAARGVSVVFSSPKDFLRPAALYGTGAAVDTSAVRMLEALEPGERRLELRLEPQEPRAGPLFLVLHTAGGDRVPARPLDVSIGVPKLTPPQEDSLWLARNVLLREGDHRDIWRLRFTRAVTPAFAFERVKEAIARERPLKLLEFATLAPAYHEAWYLARVEPSGAPLLVEVAVRGPGRLIEFRAATDSLGDLLGVKAEYRRRVRELLSERFMGKQAIVRRAEALPPTVEETPPHLHSSLLVRHMQGELGAEDLWRELRRTATGGSGEGWQYVAAMAEALGPLTQAAAKDGRKPPRPPRAPSLIGVHAENEAFAGLFESYSKFLVPVVLAQTARMVRTGARLRTGLDSSAEAEAEAAED